MQYTGDRVAIITGASQGIGAALVEAYRKHGYAVIANARTIAESHEPDVTAVPGDIADPATAQRVITEAIARYGRVDTLVNNAGVFLAKPFTMYTPADYDLVTGVNLAGFFQLTQRVIADMLDRGHGGHIVNVTTTLVEHAHAAVPSALTALTKGGLSPRSPSRWQPNMQATESVSMRYPPVSSTPPCTQVWMRTRSMPACTQNRIGAVADIVHGVLYLETAPFVTGEFLHIDGGQSAGH